MTATPAHLVVGTAGHVDHGKTALVRALTGVDCDRLPEEKARGITIELGFARWTLGDLEASVVDVPGHERLVRTMVAGASGLDAMILVVAADDGVMPQTREHLAIAELLGVKTGIVALTKSDLAEDDLLALVEDDIRTATAGTFLASAELVRCSAKTGAGVADLAPALVRAIAARPPRSRAGPAFVALDRVFVRPGIGTVATGTLTRGTVRLGDELEVADGTGDLVRVRGLEVHGTKREEVTAASRIALAVHGDRAADLARGMVLAAPRSVHPATGLHATLTPVRGVDERVSRRRRSKVTLHVGTTSREAELTVLTAGDEEVLAVRLAPRVALPVYSGQRFVLRRAGRSGMETFAGGEIVDPAPMRARRRVDPLSFLGTGGAERVLALVREARWNGIALADVRRRLPADLAPEDILAALAEQGAIVESAERWLSGEHLAEATAGIRALLAELHAQRPLLAGFAAGELTTRAPPRFRLLVPLALARLAASNVTVIAPGELHALAEHVERSARRSELLDRIASHFRAGGLAPPTDEVACTELGLDPGTFRDAIGEIRRAGGLRLIGGLHFDTAALDGLREAVRRWFAEHATLLPTDLKHIAAVTRRHAIPLLEWLDQERVTRRQGDVRVPTARDQALSSADS